MMLTARDLAALLCCTPRHARRILAREAARPDAAVAVVTVAAGKGARRSTRALVMGEASASI